MKWNKLITFILLLSLFAYISETEKRIFRSYASGSLQSLTIDSLQRKGKEFLYASIVKDRPGIGKRVNVISVRN